MGANGCRPPTLEEIAKYDAADLAHYAKWEAERKTLLATDEIPG